MPRWGEQRATGQYSDREAQQSDVRPRSVNRRVLRSDDALFEYDDDTITPVGSRSLTADIIGALTGNVTGNVTGDVTGDVTGNASTATLSGPPGVIIMFGGSSAPTGYLACDGSAVSRTTYADLFSAIGTTWGVGDGSTTFNVPDLRGAFVRGTGSHGTETMANGNPFAGPSVGAFEDDQFQGHHHVMRVENDSAVNGTPTSTGYPARFDIDGRQQVSNVYDSVNQVVIQQASEDPTFGADRDGDETRPFAAGVLYCIKT